MTHKGELGGGFEPPPPIEIPGSIFNCKWEDVPPEYARLVIRVGRLLRLRRDNPEASFVIGHEKRLVREAYERVRDLDDEPEAPPIA